MNKDGKKVLGSIIIMDILILVMIIVVPIASFLGLLVFALGGDEDDTGRYEYDTERIYYNGSWYTDMREEYANPLDSVWIRPEDAETVEAKASYTENGKKDVSVLTYKNEDLQMFLSLGDDWPELYIKEDYSLPNYRNLKEIETIAMEYYTSDRSHIPQHRHELCR